MNGSALVTEFQKTGCDSAFAQIVERYTNLVFSAAARRLSNAALAQEATQMVFIRLARAPARFRSERELVAWLHRTTVHVSIDLWRSEQRRRVREEQATTMDLTSNETSTWREIAPVLDEALNELNENDRQAILLRFFAGKPMRDVGVSLGVTEDAAKMRVSRAVDRLRRLLGARGVTCTAAALGAMLEESAVQMAPPAVAAGMAALKLSAMASVGVAGRFVQVIRSPLGAGLGLVAAITILSVATVRWQAGKDDLATSMAGLVRAERGGIVSPGDGGGTTVAGEQMPNPRALLLGVARARDRISSGKMEIDYSTHLLKSLDGIANDVKTGRLNVLFDGDKRRFEMSTRGSRYVTLANEDEKLAREKQMIRDQHMDHAAAVRANILKDFDERTVTIYDGATLFTYRESDGHPQGAAIDDPSKGGAGYLFDPRVFGVGEFFLRHTVENSLGYNEAKSIELVGKETVENGPAWHVRVGQAWEGYTGTIDVWIDCGNVTHAVKYERMLSFGQGTRIAAKFDPAHPDDPIPSEIEILDYARHELFMKRRMVKSQAKYDIPVDPLTWTLAGLGMPVGVDVSDSRIHRRIGYWDGTGLSDNLPRQQKTNSEPVAAVDLVKLIHILDVVPESPEAFAAAKWIVMNTPDGPDVEKAAAVLESHHVWETNLVDIATELERFRHRSSTNLLETLMNKNPSAAVRGNACFTLATLFKEQSHYGKDAVAASTAARLFERTTKEFAAVRRPNAGTLGEMASGELDELRHGSIGQPAPETKGIDLEGRELDLRKYRGKVVVLFWWSRSTGPYELKEMRKVLQPFSGKPLVVIGVYNDDDLARPRSILATNGLEWVSFQDGARKLMNAWKVRGWLSTVVIDQEGVIRERGHPFDREFRETIEELLSPGLHGGASTSVPHGGGTR